MYAAENLLQYRNPGYGYSFGVLLHYPGQEAGLDPCEDCGTVLEPGMVVSTEPMITIPEGQPGAGGYRKHDVLVSQESGNQNITVFPCDPGHPIVKDKTNNTRLPCPRHVRGFLHVKGATC